MALTYKGVSTFAQCGPPKWSFDSWGLDRMTVPFSGPEPARAAFIGGLSAFHSSPLNGSMFFDSIASNDNKFYPTIDLIYIGKRDGGVPPDRHEADKTIQQARYVFGNVSVDLTYMAPSSSIFHWSRQTIDTSTISPPTPLDVIGIQYVARLSDASLGGVLPTSLAQAMNYFVQATAELSHSDEVVPNNYFRGTVTKQNLVFSKAG